MLGIIGFIQSRRAKKKGEAVGTPEELIPSENVPNLNDRFNRARYMDQDGK